MLENLCFRRKLPYLTSVIIIIIIYYLLLLCGGMLVVVMVCVCVYVCVCMCSSVCVYIYLVLVRKQEDISWKSVLPFYHGTQESNSGLEVCLASASTLFVIWLTCNSNI